MDYTVLLTRRAARQLADARDWWHANRLEHPALLEEEVGALIDSLGSFPYRGLSVDRSNPRSHIRYLVTDRSRYMVRYRIKPRAMRVEVVSVRYAGRLP